MTDAGPASDSGAGADDAGDTVGVDAATASCTSGERRDCTECTGAGTQLCTSAGEWGPCMEPDGPCGRCTTGDYFCASVGSSWLCERGRWQCQCACVGPKLCC